MLMRPSQSKTSATPLSSTRRRDQTSMRGSTASHHSSRMPSPGFVSSCSFMAWSLLQGDQGDHTGRADQGQPAAAGGDAAEKVQVLVTGRAVSPAHQPPTVAPAAIFGAGGENDAAV